MAVADGVVVAEQPNGTSEVVVIQQPTLRDWEDGLLDCTNDMKNRCLTAWCCPCMVCHECHIQAEHAATPLIMPCPVLVLTAYYRGYSNIQGSLLKDCCVNAWCGPCQLCRIHRDFAAH